jgi:tripartite ATP-independent transporter DctP family solute receptor
MKKVLSISGVCLFLVGILMACGGASTSSGSTGTGSASKAITFKYAHGGTPGTPHYQTAIELIDLLAERLPQYNLEHYHSNQLGNERDMIEALQMGTIDIVGTSTTALSNFVPSLTILEFLYLIRDYDHADKVLKGEIGESLMADINAAKMIGLGFYELGFRHLCINPKSINSLSDAKGLKLRVQENPVTVAGWTNLGINAITMTWTDAIAGMQQGTIDAIEVPYTLIVPQTVYDYAKYVSETNHLYQGQATIMSQKAWQNIAPEDQQIFRECVTEACRLSREYARAKTAEFREETLKRGMKIDTLDLTEWRKQSQNLYAQYDSEYGAMIKKILEL